MEGTIKTCPFCGGEAKVVNEKDIVYSVECKSCEVSTPFEFTLDAAINKWNTRISE